MVENREKNSHALATIISWLQSTEDLKEIWSFFKRFNQALFNQEDIVNIGNVGLKIKHINEASEDFLSLKKIADKIFVIVSSRKDERKVINTADFENFLINLHYVNGFLILARIFDNTHEQRVKYV